jgi:hypothetical protein
LFQFLLPDLHLFTLTWSGLFKAAGPVAVRAALSHTTFKSGSRMVNVPPVSLAAQVTTISGHRLQIKTGPQTLSGNWFGYNAAVTPVEDTAAWKIGRLAPEPSHSFQVAQQVIQGVRS